MRTLLVAVLALLPATSLQAHEMRSALLTVSEQPGGLVSLDMKISVGPEGRAAPVTAGFEPECLPRGDALAQRLDDAVLRRWTVQCSDGITGRSLWLRGLDVTTPDAFVEVSYADGGSSLHGLSRHDAVVVLGSNADKSGNGVSGLWPYFGIGVEHILLGIDHLLFVLGLLLLLQLAQAGPRQIVGAITAFTLAHSMTLALSVLAGWWLPPTPVEIVIALSIVLLAVEICGHPQRMAQGRGWTLTLRRPWVVAFGFGLLHGFGFAGALAEIGVPEQAAGWALLLFNLGVEAGQLLFVGLVLVVFFALKQIRKTPQLLPRFQVALANVIGGVAMFWVLQRSMSLLTV